MIVDHDALREKYRLERDKRLRPDGNDQYLEPSGKFAVHGRRPLRRLGRARAGVRRGDRRAHRRRLLGAVRGRAAQAGRHRRRAHHRGRGRRRWGVVLEPVSGRDVRHRGDGLSAAARGDRQHAVGEVRPRARDLRPLPSHRHDLRPPSQRPVLDLGDRAGVGRGDGALDHPNRPRRRHPRPVRRHGHRPAQPAQAARHPGDRDLRRSLLPHQPVGLRLHRRRLDRCADDEPGRQAGRDHRHRGHRRPVHPAPGPGRAGALRVPAHAFVGRRPQQPPDRSGLVRRPRARVAAADGC